MPDWSGKTIKHYRVEQLIGRGGMAAVYKAQDSLTQQSVAMKIMYENLSAQPRFRERFLQEAETLKRLQHPNIVSIIDSGDWQGDYFLVMEYVGGGDLRKYLKRVKEEHRYIDYAEAIELVRQLADALDYAHAIGMTHRDIKPENILLMPESNTTGYLRYRPIITDFGLIQLAGEGEEAITQDEPPMGTYPYMSPEQTREGGSTDGRTDVYALGVMLYELTVGRLPFNPKTLRQAEEMHTRTPVERPSSLRPNFPKDLEAIILRCLEKDPEDRYQRLSELETDLAAIQRKIYRPVTVETEEVATSYATTVLDQPEPPDLPIYSIPTIPEADRHLYDYLILISPKGLQTVRLQKDEISIGRDAHQDLHLEDDTISREHARLERQPNGRYYITDLGADNGTWVDGRRLKKDETAVFEPKSGVGSSGSTLWIPPYHIELLARIAERKNEDEDESEELDTNISGKAASDSQVYQTPVPETESPSVVAIPLTEVSGVQAAPVVPTAPLVSPGDETVSSRSSESLDPGDGLVTETLLGLIPVEMKPTLPTLVLSDVDRLVIYSDDPAVLQAEKNAQAEMPKVITLERPRYRIGRSARSDIRLYHPSASYRHAEIAARAGGQFYIRPIKKPRKKDNPALALTDQPTLERSSIVYLDNAELAPEDEVRLNANKSIRLGRYWLTYVPAGSLPAVQTIGLPGGAVQPSKPAEDEYDDTVDTVVMVKSIPEKMPTYSLMDEEIRKTNHLVFMSEYYPIQAIKLDKERLTIGRAANQNVRLRGRRVSREHVEIEAREGRLYLYVKSEKNPVYIGDTRILPKTRARWDVDSPNERVVRIGDYWMTFERGTGGSILAVSGRSEPAEYARVNTKLDEYQIIDYLGQNTLAATYRARDTNTNMAVALKVLHRRHRRDEVLTQQFREEGRVLQQHPHEHIVKINKVRDIGNEVALVMELVPGGSLRGTLNKFRNDGTYMNYDQLVDLMIQISKGLQHAHQQKLLHRVIKPENVTLKGMVSLGAGVNAFFPVLTDFKVQNYAESGEVDDTTEEGRETLPYMSPEQLRGEKVDRRSNLYELGCVMYECVVGYPPFRKPQSVLQARQAHGREAVQRPSELREVPRSLEAIILKCLQKDPQDRYQNATDLENGLMRCMFDVTKSGLGSDLFTGRYPSVAGGVDESDEFSTQVQPQQMPPSRTMSRFVPPPRPEGDKADRLVLFNDKETLAFTVNKNILTIGRDGNQDIQPPDPNRTVSRRHVRVERGIDGSYRLTGLNPVNGVWMGNHWLTPDVTEIWEFGQTARVGEYWLRLDRYEEPIPEEFLRRRRSGTAGAGVGLEDYDEGDEFITSDGSETGDAAARQGTVPAIKLPPPEHDKIGLTPSTTTVRVMPGSSATMSIEVANQSPNVGDYIVELNGLPAPWYTLQVQRLNLMPNNRQTMSITFHPPLLSSSTAGSHAFEIRVRETAYDIKAVHIQCTLIIEPVNSYVTELYPDRVRNKGRVELIITNTGNTYGTYSLTGRDREGTVRFDLEGNQYVMPPGYVERVPIQVRPRRRHLFGAQRQMPFEIITTPTPLEIAGGPQTRTGELVVTSRFRIWMFVLPIVLILLCLGLSALAIYFNVRTTVDANNQTATAKSFATATSVAATATASVFADDDNDGLSNLREAELKTDPKVADTDLDGLTDGEEINVWATSPTNRDTDGDNLADGEEVKLGTNPAKEDTDGDGILDGQDPFPGQVATPTITPVPTIPGTIGDVCPGSPIPSRLSVGMQAKVEKGGVANRVRVEPNLEAEVVISMSPESTFIIIDGPVCDEEKQLRWWKIRFEEVEGWTAEGEAEEYYLCPPDECDKGDAEGDSGSSTEGDGGSSASAAQTVSNLPGDGTVAINRTNVGVQLYTNLTLDAWNTTISYVDPLEFGWVKFQANWRFLQAAGKGELTPELHDFTERIRASGERGYNVLVSVAKAPDWARTKRDLDGPPDNPDDLADFVDQLLGMVGQHIDAVEIWNEPNIRREWTGSLAMSGSGYMRLFEPTYERIRAYSEAHNQRIIIVTAGLAPTGKSSSGVNDRTFLRQMYEAGLEDHERVAVGIHPYGWGNPPDTICCNPIEGRGWDDAPQFFFLNTLVDYRRIMREYDHDTRLWVTEFGWTTWSDLGTAPPETWMGYISPDDQANYTVRALEIGQSLTYIGPMFLWNFNFANPTTVQNRNEQAGYSLMVMDAQMNLYARPVYARLARREK